MITESDNTAGDAVLKAVGGPSAVQRRLSALGFNGIHVNRYEGEIAFEMMGVVEPPPESEWTLEAQHDVGVAVYESFTGKLLPPPQSQRGRRAVKTVKKGSARRP